MRDVLAPCVRRLTFKEVQRIYELLLTTNARDAFFALVAHLRKSDALEALGVDFIPAHIRRHFIKKIYV